MQPEDRDASYLWDMLDAAKAALKFTDGITLEAYGDDRMLRMAVERAIELIGEAARRVSDSFKIAHPENIGRKKLRGNNRRDIGYQNLRDGSDCPCKQQHRT